MSPEPNPLRTLRSPEFWDATVRNQFVPLAIVVGIFLILCTLIAGGVASHLRTLDNTLSVTGSAKTQVEANSVKWSFQITRTADNGSLATANNELASDLRAVSTLLSQNKVPESEITIDPVMTNPTYSNSGTINGYTLSRTVTINSTRVADIGALAQDSTTLVNQGVFVQANAPEYYYTKLADIRVQLLRDAVKDAKARAGAIADESGQHVGRLQSSTSGVVQVLAPNSVDVDDYGQYDTSSVTKEVTVTLRATFFVD